MKLIDVLDGSGKQPRPIQVEIFDQIEEALASKCKVVGVNGPPGIGKSFIARTINRAFDNSAILTVNNVLVDQYIQNYPELNPVKGRDWYDSPADYRESQKRAKNEDSVFNPLSFYYWYLRDKSGKAKPDVVIIDEAHKLGDLLLLTVTQSFSTAYYGIPEGLSDKEFLEWLYGRVNRLNSPKILGRNEKLTRDYEKCAVLYDYLKDNLDKVKITYEDEAVLKWGKPTGATKRVVQITPVTLPHDLLRTIFGPKAKYILLSGSLTPLHLKEMFPDENIKISYRNYEPLAPVENRPIYYTPLETARTDSRAMAAEIKRIYEREGEPNTLVHLSYAQAAEVAMHLRGVRGVMKHNKETKMAVLERFKERGGLLLACGMAEGVDLPHDQCRLIIVPRLLYPYLGDQAVKKRMALPNGQEWYATETMMTTVQQIGRGVRGADDACKTYILDNTFPRLVNQTRAYLTDGFIKSIKWNS